MANWYHPDCFFLKFPPGNPRCPISASTDIKGIHDLTWEDLLTIACKNLHEPEFSHGRTPSTRKIAYVHTALRNALGMLDIADLKRLLEHNGQRTRAGCGKRDVMRRCIDGMLYGALPQCPECKSEGTLYWDMDIGAYKCSADASEWAECQFEMKDFGGLTRTKWKMIEEFSGIKWLDEWVQPDKPEDVAIPSGSPFNDDNNSKKSDSPSVILNDHSIFGFNSAFSGLSQSSNNNNNNLFQSSNINNNNTLFCINQNDDLPSLFMGTNSSNDAKSSIFQGMFIYVASNSRYLMRQESRRVELAGGSFVRKFDKNIDLYVARSRTSSRIELICDWYGIPVVTPDYFAECFKRDALLDPAYFEPNQYIKTAEIKPWEGYTPIRNRKGFEKGNSKKSTPGKNKKTTDARKEEFEDNVKSHDLFDLNDDDHYDNSDSEDENNNITFASTGSYFTGSMYEPFKAAQPAEIQQLCDVSNFDIQKEEEEPTKEEERGDPFRMYLASYSSSDGIFLNPGSSEPVCLMGPKAIKLSMSDAPFEPTQQQQQQSSTHKHGRENAVKKAKKVPVCKKAVNKDTGLTEKYHVMVVAGSDEKDLYNAVLSSSDLSTQQNSYYYMQVLEPDDMRAGLPYAVWMKWGRVGTPIGKSKVERTKSADAAIRIFCEKYREKTLNDWSMRKSFRKMPKAFYPLDVDYGDENDGENDIENDGNAVPSKLDRRVYKLVETLFDADKIRKEMASIGIDTTKMPLGKLRRETVMSGYTTLKELESVIAAGSAANKARLLELSNKFYTIIPHSFGVGVSPPLISTKELLLSKMSMMETLADIEVAAGLMKEDNDNEGSDSGTEQQQQQQQKQPQNHIDKKYRRMHVELTPVEHESSEWDFLRSAIRNTVPKACGFRLDLGQAFRVVRRGEQERFEPYSHADGRRLLWHGSRLTNYVGILSQGLRIAPPEAPVSGYMFGKGIYLADMGGKSAEYCHATPDSPSGIVLLCEAALGTDPLRLKRALYVEKGMLESMGKESAMGLGRLNPAPSNNRVVKTKGGLLMKSGAVVAMGPEEPSDAGGDCELEHNEFIVYDVSRVVIRYALEVNFTFADGWEARDITYGLKK